MITAQLQSELKHFLQLNVKERISLLHQKGLLLDSDVEKECRVNLYYLNGFFVEEIQNSISTEVEDIIPYISGYRLKTYLDRITEHYNYLHELRNVG